MADQVHIGYLTSVSSVESDAELAAISLYCRAHELNAPLISYTDGAYHRKPHRYITIKDATYTVEQFYNLRDRTRHFRKPVYKICDTLFYADVISYT